MIAVWFLVGAALISAAVSIIFVVVEGWGE